MSDDWGYYKPKCTKPDVSDWDFNIEDKINLESIAQLGVNVFFECSDFEVWAWPDRKNKGQLRIGIDQDNQGGEAPLFEIDFIDLLKNSLQWEVGSREDWYEDDEYTEVWQRYKDFADKVMKTVMEAKP